MEFIILILLLILTIVGAATAMWYSGTSRWMHTPVSESEKQNNSAEDRAAAARSTRLAVSFAALTALVAYLLVGKPYIVMYQSGKTLDESEIVNNILILSRYIDDRYTGIDDLKTDDFARAQFQLAEYLTASGEYFQASEKLWQLHELWPQERDLLRHYSLALALASLRASRQNQTDRAQSLRLRLKGLIDEHPYLRETVREIFALYLNSQTLAQSSPGAAQLPSREQSSTTDISLSVKISYRETESIMPGAILFVSAHSMGEDASAMPVAARKFTEQPFPELVEISSADVLNSGLRLGDHSILEIRARISQMGRIERHKSDMIGTVKAQTDLPDRTWLIEIGGASR